MLTQTTSLTSHNNITKTSSLDQSIFPDITASQKDKRERIMQRQRQRIYSFSSNETILEAYSSSPPSSAGLAEPDSTPTWQLSARDLIKPLYRNPKPGAKSTPKARGPDNARSSTNARVEEHLVSVVEEPDEDDSDEFVDWDEEPEEQQQRVHIGHCKVPSKESSYPQTVAFWFDWWVAEVATAAVNVHSLVSLSGFPTANAMPGRSQDPMRQYDAVERAE